MTGAPTPSANPSAAPAPQLGTMGRMLLMGALTLLLLELILGLGTNVAYASLPSSPGGIVTAGSSYPLAVAHIVIGYLLGLLALLLLLVVVRRLPETPPRLWSLLGLLGVGGAGVAGMMFVTSGGADAWSDAMAVAWLFTLAMFLLLERSTRPSRTPRAVAPS